MTVNELIKLLKYMPEDAEIRIEPSEGSWERVAKVSFSESLFEGDPACVCLEAEL